MIKGSSIGFMRGILGIKTIAHIIPVLYTYIYIYIYISPSFPTFPTERSSKKP